MGRNAKKDVMQTIPASWEYNTAQNYGQLGSPQNADDWFNFKIKVDKAEICAQDIIDPAQSEWRVKIDGFGTSLQSRLFTFTTAGIYNPERKQGFLVHLRAEKEALAQFMIDETLSVDLDCLVDNELLATGSIAIKLTQCKVQVHSNPEEKWRRMTREVKMFPVESNATESFKMKISLLFVLINTGSVSDQEAGQMVEVKVESKENLEEAASSGGIQVNRFLKRNSQARLTEYNAPSVNARKNQEKRKSLLSLGQLMTKLEEKSGEIQDLKDKHSAEILEWSKKYHEASIQLSGLRLKSIQNDKEHVQNLTEVFTQTMPDELEEQKPVELLKKSEEMDNQLKVLQNLKNEYNARISSLSVKEEALQVRSYQKTTPSSRRFCVRKTSRETIEKKQKLNRLIHSAPSILEFVQEELIASLISEILTLEGEKATLGTGSVINKKLEEEILMKTRLLSSIQQKPK